jgi:hypothetical protein
MHRTEFSTGQIEVQERTSKANVLSAISARVWCAEDRHAGLNFLVTASVFATLYIGLAVMSALATKVVHEQLASRSSVGVVHQ